MKQVKLLIEITAHIADTDMKTDEGRPIREYGFKDVKIRATKSDVTSMDAVNLLHISSVMLHNKIMMVGDSELISSNTEELNEIFNELGLPNVMKDDLDENLMEGEEE